MKTSKNKLCVSPQCMTIGRHGNRLCMLHNRVFYGKSQNKKAVWKKKK